MRYIIIKQSHFVGHSAPAIAVRGTPPKRSRGLTPILGLKTICGWKLVGVHPEMVDFGSERGLSVFATAGIVSYSEDCKKAKTQLWAERCH